MMRTKYLNGVREWYAFIMRKSIGEYESRIEPACRKILEETEE